MLPWLSRVRPAESATGQTVTVDANLDERSTPTTKDGDQIELRPRLLELHLQLRRLQRGRRPLRLTADASAFACAIEERRDALVVPLMTLPGLSTKALDRLAGGRGPREDDGALGMRHYGFLRARQMVAQGGVEPPTPRFSVACSTN